MSATDPQTVDDFPQIFHGALTALGQVPVSNDLLNFTTPNRLLRQWVNFIGGLATSGRRGFAYDTLSVAVNTILTANNDGTMVMVDASGGTRVITLPNPAALRDGWNCIIFKNDTSLNEVQVTGGGGTINNGVAAFSNPSLDVQTEALFICRQSATNWSVTAIDISTRGASRSGQTTNADVTTTGELVDGSFFNVDTSGANRAVALADPATVRSGYNIIVRKSTADVNTVTITPAAGTINGAANLVLSVAGQFAIIVRVTSTTYIAITGSGGLTSVVGLGNTVYVSKDGNDATGQRENLALPFLTIGAALLASQADDTIVIGPGTYTENLTLLEKRSIVGSGNRTTIVAGTATLTAPANANGQSVNFDNFQITGLVTLNYGAKTAGDVLVNTNNMIFGGGLTMSRPINGAYSLRQYACQSTTTTSNGFNNVFCRACEFTNSFVFAASGGSEVVVLEACSIPTCTITGATTTVRISGCDIITALTFTDGFGGTVTTTGCNLSAATITINSGTWFEYGCTFAMANVAGASGNKRISFQRFTKALTGGGAADACVFPVPIGATTYLVTATQLTGASIAGPVISLKTGTQFTATLAGAASDWEFGVFFRP